MSGPDFSLDEDAMARAIELARLGVGKTWPNPMVGCVVVRNGALIAEGYHHRHGEDHAEVDALRKVGFEAQGATLFVNLEPCCHYGCTPPCTDAILRSGISRVVVGMLDGNPLVNGKGVRILEDAGLDVRVGVLEGTCRALNEVYAVNLTSPRPFVTLKAAMTADGRLATRTGKSKWITGETARHHVHEERAAHQAVLVGVGTVLSDDPSLTVRLPGQEEGLGPIRVVLDSTLRTPPSAKLFTSTGKVIICTTSSQMGNERAQQLKGLGAELIACAQVEEGNCAAGFEVVRVDPSTLRTEVILDHPGTATGGVSSALVVGDQLYVGTFSGDRVGRADYAP